MFLTHKVYGSSKAGGALPLAVCDCSHYGCPAHAVGGSQTLDREGRRCQVLAKRWLQVSFFPSGICASQDPPLMDLSTRRVRTGTVMLHTGNGKHQDFRTFLTPCICVSNYIRQRQLKHSLQSGYSEDQHLCPICFLVAT